MLPLVTCMSRLYSNNVLGTLYLDVLGLDLDVSKDEIELMPLLIILAPVDAVIDNSTR